ncbi:MAG: hypothetical protein ABIH23_28620, partial [bacterium]
MCGKQSNIVRYIVGYITGLGTFVILFPVGLWFLSTIDWFLFQLPILPFDLPRVALAAMLFIIGVVFILWSNLFLFFEGKGGPTDLPGVSI